MRVRKVLSAFVVLSLLSFVAVGIRASESPDGPGSQALPSGAATEAPEQLSGSAEDLTAGGSTETTLHSAARRPVRPAGAVADKLAVPPLDPPKAQPQQRLTDVKTSTGPRPSRGYDADTSTELPAERTATSQVFQNKDGTRTRRLYDRPVYARRADGTWAPVELNLAPDGADRIAPKLGPYRMSLAPTATGGNLVTLAVDGTHEVSFGLRGAAAVSGQVSGERVTYPAVRPDADLLLDATGDGLKEAIVLRSADAPSTYDFDLRLRGLTPALDSATGAVTLADGKRAVRAVIPAGWMRDAKGVESRGVRYQLRHAGQDWVLRVQLDEEWLGGSGRAYPVTVDPSIQINADGDDTYVTSGAPGNHSGESTLRLGNAGSGRVSAAYLHFAGLAGSLANQYIVGAALNLYNIDSGSCTAKPVDLYAVGAPWSGPQLTTWPGAPLGRHLSQRSFSAGRSGCPAAWAALPLNPDLATDWTHGTPFYGLSVRAANEADTGAFKQFASANTPAGTGKPYLDVTYSAQGAAYAVDEVVLPTNNRSGTLKATIRNRGSATWPAGGQHKFGFTVKQGAAEVQKSEKFALPKSVPPNGSVTVSVPIAPVAPGDYQVYMTMYDGASDYQAAYGVPYGRFALRVQNVPPSTDLQQPGNGAFVDSIRPTLYARGIDDDNWPNTGFKFNFKLCSGTPEAPTDCIESGWTNATWAPPAGRLRWSETYYWWVQVHDNVTPSTFYGPIQLNTQVPQPEITSHLGGTPAGAPAPGIDPQVGNYGMSSTDASVATVGPDLAIIRTYNSLDPRAGNAFGAGWASRLDTVLTEDNDGSGNVTVTLPTGRQVRFGRNTDGTYAPPMGQSLTLAYSTSTAEYTLRDAAGNRWLFNPCGRLRRITDPAGLAEELTYDVGCPGGKPVRIRNLTSGRQLDLTWTGGHVTRVSTDPPASGAAPLTWTYSYNGDQLASVCDPAPAPNCTRYDYQAGSHYRSVVVDDSPGAYWRLGERSSAAGATNATARTPGADQGTYHSVTLGVTGALAGTDDSAAAFNGQSSWINLPGERVSSTITLAVEMWFKTTAGGVLMSYADQPFGSGTPSKLQMPVLYVGQDGFLRGGFWAPDNSGKTQIVSDAAVNDGQWHHVALSGAIDTQKLYLDGVAQKDDTDPTKDDTVTGLIDHDEMPYLTVGTGKTVDWPSGNDGNYFFAGTIDEVAVYQHPLGATAVAQHAASTPLTQQLSKVTTAQDDRVAAQLSYDTANDRVARYTDHDGRAWTLDTPSRNGAVRQVALHGPYPDYVYQYDADHGGRLTKRTYDGKSRGYTYNTAGFRSAETDELGHQVKFTTDDRGNVLSQMTCREQRACQTLLATYFVNPTDPLDPRNDRILIAYDARSSGLEDPRFRTTYEYDTAGRLTSVTYPRPAGVTTTPAETWKYSLGSESADGGGTVPAGLLVEHTGRRSGQVTSFRYRSNGDLAQETAPLGLRTRYGYDGIGRTTSRTQQTATGGTIGTTSYTYTPRSQIETVTSPAVTNPVTGVRHTLVTRYGYDANGNNTEVTQADTTGGDQERRTTYAYDAHDALVKTTFPDGATQTREYRDAGMEERVTDRAGTTWINNYDGQGRLLRQATLGPGVAPEDPDAEALVLAVQSYDAAGRLAATSDAMGRQTRYTYYDDDLLATVTRKNVLQADGSRHDVVLDQREYDPAGNLTKVTAAGGRVTWMAYDLGGYLATETFDPDELHRVTTYTRAADGLPVTVDRTGAAQPGRVESTSYRYDVDGNLLAEDVRPLEGDQGSVLTTSYARDERGLVVRSEDRKRLPTTYTYDALGQLATQTGAQVDTWVNGQRHTGVTPQTTLGYNAFGEVTHAKDPNGAVTTMGYDTLGQIRSMRRPDYTPPGGATIHAETRIDYDALGNPISTKDALDHTTRRTFDPYGRLLTQTLPQVGDEPSTTTMRYDNNGEVLAVTDPNGATNQFTYDELGRTLTATAVERQPRQAFYITKFGYDDAGNPRTVTTPSGHAFTATYNAAGEQLTGTDPTNRTTTFTHDNAGRTLTTTDPAKITTRTDYNLIGQPTAVVQLTGNPQVEQRRWTPSYDPDDNLTSLTSPADRVDTFGYDAMNRLVRQDEEVDGDKTIHTTFGYDAAGNRTRFVDGNGHATDYTFTPWGQKQSTIEPATVATPDAADRTWTTSYDAVGNAVRMTIPGGVVRTAEFDAQNRRTVQHGTGAEAPTADRTFAYDPAGQLAAFGGPDGATELSYDDRGNLLTTRGPGGDATFTYTADGQLMSRQDATGASSYSYDGAGRTASVTDGLSGRTIDYRYDPAGRLAYTAEHGLESVVKRVNDYDALGRLTRDEVTEYGVGAGDPWVVHGTEYGYDKDDNVTTKKTITNNVSSANTYDYDGADRLTSWTAPGGATTAYQWDDAGNRTKAGPTTFTYDERNQLRTGGDTTYTYSPRGTIATAGDRTLGFDAFDQLRSDGAEYSYDSLGRVARHNDNNFSYSGLDNGVVSDGERLTSRGVDGEPFADKAAGSTDAGKLLYSDQHGDVTGRYAGTETDGTRTFDPFGGTASGGAGTATDQASTKAAGETPSVGYQGGWTEPDTGAVNMFSRWYDPGTGAFSSRDSFTNTPLPSAAGNRHAYAAANPIGNVDPTGHDPCQALTSGPACGGPPFSLPSVGHAGGVIQGPHGGPSSGSRPSPGHGRGGSPTGGGGNRPPPPPPPLWQRNLFNPPPRPPAGSTTPPRPSSTPSWQEGHSNLVDRSQMLATQATELTQDPVEPSGIQPQNADYEPDCPRGSTYCGLEPIPVPDNSHADQQDPGAACPPGQSDYCASVAADAAAGARAGSHDFGASCQPGDELYCSTRLRDLLIKKLAELLGIDPALVAKTLDQLLNAEAAGEATRSLSICFEVTVGIVLGAEVERCINFDKVGVTLSQTGKAGFLAGVEAAGKAVVRYNGGEAADEIGGHVGDERGGAGFEFGEGPVVGVEIEGTSPWDLEEFIESASVAVKAGAGAGASAGSDMWIWKTGNSGYVLTWN